MKFYTHKTTSISVIDAKFHKNPLLRLRDFQFFQTAVTNLIYRYCQPFVQSLVTSSPSSRTKPQLTVQCAREKRLRYCQLRHPTSSAHWIGHRTVQIQSGGLCDLGRVYRCQILDVDHLKEWLIEEWRRFDQNIIDREQWISGMIDCINVYARIGDTSNIIMIWTCWLFRLTSTACAGNSWLVGNVI